MRSQLVSRVIVLAALLGCGSAEATDPTGGTGGKAGSGTCSITLSGGRSGSLTCSSLAAIRTDNNNKTGFGFKGVDATDTLTVAIGLTGAPVVRTYVSGADASPAMLLFNANTIWTTTPSDGSLTLTITSVKTLNSGAGLTSYEVHGTLTATMIAEVSNGSVAPVAVTATF